MGARELRLCRHSVISNNEEAFETWTEGTPQEGLEQLKAAEKYFNEARGQKRKKEELIQEIGSEMVVDRQGNFPASFGRLKDLSYINDCKVLP